MDREAILTAGDRNLAAVLRHYTQHAPDGAVVDDGRLLLVSSSPTWPGPYHNGALRLDASLPAEEVLTRAGAFFVGRCAGHCLWIAAHADDDLEELAVGAGYVSLGEGTPRMALDRPIDPPVVPDGVVLEEVVDEAGRQEYLAVTSEAYAAELLPADAAAAMLASLGAVRASGVRSVLARVDGAAVAAAMVVVAGGMAGVQLVGTVPAARGRGLGELCTRWAVQAGFELGATAVVLEASDMGAPIYRRMGFTELSRYRYCLGPPPPRKESP